MLKEKPLAIDYFQEDAPLQILPNVPLLTSHKSGWNSIQLAYHRQPPLELRELYNFQHILAIPLGGRAVAIEVFSDDCLQNVQYSPGDYTNGGFSILPANQPYKLSWNSQDYIHRTGVWLCKP